MTDGERLAQHDEQIKTLFCATDRLEKMIEAMKSSIDEIQTKLMYRPTWTVTIIVSVLIAVSTASLTFAFTVIRGLIK